ncbi:hypothetical protein C427_5403 [Paraglaciecola psychrophila 170]|uniref:Uncharacterized protein n=1 Tax=Paraglaciecola psychrophila 170 TaxID=1129794 RepID=K7A3X9_9ALTE|nr:hypothetical protein C427_5403 [Paraglaciecola psychrophila 170]GAC37072.1 hypothetical protein GPSY_1437 [Paraglaciecola psychrophila 170]
MQPQHTFRSQILNLAQDTTDIPSSLTLIKMIIVCLPFYFRHITASIKQI